MRERRTHWLRLNEASRYPRRIVCLDSEAVTTREGRLERHGHRISAASFDTIDPATRAPKRSEESVFLDPVELWAWIDQRTTKKERTVVFAHNLGYDLRLTRALEILPGRGWALDSFSLDSYRCWMRWRRDGATLLLVDSMSFVAGTLAKYADALGVAKPPLPRQDAPIEAWRDRVLADVRLLRALALRLLSWLEESDSGNFRMTGPAQGSAAFRHRFLPERTLLVHDDREALDAERRSCWTGRCEVWRHGRVAGPLHEWDYSLAYARVARRAELPVRLRGSVGRCSIARYHELRRRFAVLADVTVETAEPVVPTVLDERMGWPIGRFGSTLWDCEIDAAIAAGATVTIERAWLYRRAPLLRAWGDWIVDELEGEGAERCPVARAVLKQWSRSLIGRFGLRYPRWEQAGSAAEPDLLWLPFVDGDTGETGVYLRIGDQVLTQEGEDESPDSAPSVMAYVMALSRVRLWNLIRALPAGALVYVDTDSVIVTEAGSRVVERLAAEPEHEGLRLKHRYRRGSFYAPRQYEIDGVTRAAGLPRDAKQVGARTFETVAWEGAAESVRRRRPGEVVVTTRRVRLERVDRRRRHLAGGATAPFAVDAALHALESSGRDGTAPGADTRVEPWRPALRAASSA